MLADDMHTMGPTSYAFMREQLKKEDPEKREPSKAKVYGQSRKRNPEKLYKTSFGKAKQNIEQMEAIESEEREGCDHKDSYGEVMSKPEHGGRVRLYGRGVTMTALKKGGINSSYIFPKEYLESMESQVMDQVLQANPELQKLIEANPGVKIVLPSMSRSASNGKTPASASNENSSLGAHSGTQLVLVEQNVGMEVENDVQT